MSGEYTPTPEVPTTDAPYGEWTGFDLGSIGDLLPDLHDFGGYRGTDPGWEHPEPDGGHSWFLNDGVSQEVAEQVVEYVDPSTVYAQDNDLDGTADYYYAENSDGYVTFSAFDQDQDGVLEDVSVDTDGDGTLDQTSFDTDGDGVIDTTISL